MCKVLFNSIYIYFKEEKEYINTIKEEKRSAPLKQVL